MSRSSCTAGSIGKLFILFTVLKIVINYSRNNVRGFRLHEKLNYRGVAYYISTEFISIDNILYITYEVLPVKKVKGGGGNLPKFLYSSKSF